jgi:hypothetical protein
MFHRFLSSYLAAPFGRILDSDLYTKTVRVDLATLPLSLPPTGRLESFVSIVVGFQRKDSEEKYVS